MKSVLRHHLSHARLVPPAPASAVSGMTGGPSPRGGRYPMAAQSFSFRKFDLEGSVRSLKELGLDLMEFCGAHFPADPDNPELPEIKRFLAHEGVRVPCYGVVGFGGDKAANRKKFEFARAIGADILSADPAPESFDDLDKLCAEFGIKIAIHNHGPGAHYDKIEDTLKAVKDHSPLIGACVDTGHAIRSGDKPHEVIHALGDRVISVHLKDWKHGDRETILGQGDLDMVEVARALMAIAFTGPVIMEYEESPEGPVPDMRQGMKNWFEAVEAADAASEDEGFGSE